MMDGIPDHMQSTYRLLKGAFPDGIPEESYYPLLAVMKEAEMSDRSVAHAIGLYYGKDYTEHLYHVAHEMPNRSISEGEKCQIKDLLRPHGFEQWMEEE